MIPESSEGGSVEEVQAAARRGPYVSRLRPLLLMFTGAFRLRPLLHMMLLKHLQFNLQQQMCSVILMFYYETKNRSKTQEDLSLTSRADVIYF